MKWLFKFVFKWMLRLVLLLVVLGVAALLLKDSVLRTVTENRIRARTGMEAKIGRFSSGIFTPAVTIENLKLYNPPEFGGGLFLDVPELRLEVSRRALVDHKLRLALVRLNLAELDIVKNEAGQTNVYSLATRAREAKRKGDGFDRWIEGLKYDGIEVLNLTLGRVKFVDLKETRNNRQVEVNMRGQVFKDVKTDADVLGILIMAWLHSGGKLSALSPEGMGAGGGPIEAAAPARK
jgi:hypothetical protein